MMYCYATMKTTAIENPSRMKISIEEFIHRFDMWSIFTSSPDSLEEIAIGLMDGLTDDQIRVYANRFLTKKEMIALRTMLSNGISIEEANKIRTGFEVGNHRTINSSSRDHMDDQIRRYDILCATQSFK